MVQSRNGYTVQRGHEDINVRFGDCPGCCGHHHLYYIVGEEIAVCFYCGRLGIRMEGRFQEGEDGPGTLVEKWCWYEPEAMHSLESRDGTSEEGREARLNAPTS